MRPPKAVLASVAAVVVAAVALCACLGPEGRVGEPPEAEMRDTAAALEMAFDTLAELKVQEFRQSDWCSYLAYERGLFSQNNERSGCNLALMRLQQPEGILGHEETYPPFDADTLRDFEVVSGALEATGVRIRTVRARYDADGAISWAIFGVEGGVNRCDYFFHPGYGDLPEDIPREIRYTSINEDWYFRWIEWL